MTGTSLYSRLPIFAQNWACTYAGWRRARDRFTPHFRRSLERCERTAKGSEEELLALQQKSLAALVARARRHVPHYRALDLPDPIENSDPAEGLRRMLDAIPILDRQDYRDAPESFLAEDIPASRLVRGKTSGTTGSALPLWYTQETIAEEFAFVWRGRRAAGVEVSSPHATFGGQVIVPLEQTTPPFWRYNAWQKQQLFSGYHLSDRFLPHYVEALHDLRVHYLQGYPSSLHIVARAMLDAARPLPPGRLRGVFTSSESLLAYQREAIEEAFGAQITDRYGTSEFAVSMTTCRKNRYHVDMEFGIVEVEVEEETEEWERGDLLVTGLSTEATPLLRYRIGDVGTRKKGPCECGRAGQVFLAIDGRVEDYIVTPDGRWIGRLDHIFKEQLDVAEAQIIQQQMDSVEFHIVPRPSFDEHSQRNLIKEIRSRLGEEIQVQIELVSQIPREPNGKFCAVKSRIGRRRP